MIYILTTNEINGKVSNKKRTLELEGKNKQELAEKYRLFLKIKKLTHKVKWKLELKNPGPPIEKLDEIAVLAKEREKIDFVKKKKKEAQELAVQEKIKELFGV